MHMSGAIIREKVRPPGGLESGWAILVK